MPTVAARSQTQSSPASMMAATRRQRLGSPSTLNTAAICSATGGRHEARAHGAHPLRVDDEHVAVVEQVLVVLAADHRLAGEGLRSGLRSVATVVAFL